MAVTIQGTQRLSVRIDADAMGGAGGETLEYSVITTDGLPAHFAITDARIGRRLLSSQDPPASASTWRRQWPLLGEPFAERSEHNLVISFLEAKRYRYVVTRRDAAGNTTPLVDLEIRATAATDMHRQSVIVRVV